MRQVDDILATWLSNVHHILGHLRRRVGAPILAQTCVSFSSLKVSPKDGDKTLSLYLA